MTSKTSAPPRTPKTNDVRPHPLWPDEVLIVGLQNRQSCLVSKVRFQALQALGHTGRWRSNSNGRGCSYVRLEGRSNLLTVARLITGCAPEEAVRYLNGNRFDLRDENLKVTPKRGGKRKNVVQHALDRFPGDREAQVGWLRDRSGRPRPASSQFSRSA
jgi:hypothetical protein